MSKNKVDYLEGRLFPSHSELFESYKSQSSKKGHFLRICKQVKIQFTFMSKKEVAFLEGQLLSRQSEQ